MQGLLLAVINMSIIASIVIAVVLIVRLLLKRAPKTFSYALWVAVLFRLLCPVSLEGTLGFFPKSGIIPPMASEQSASRADTGVEGIGTTGNKLLDGGYVEGINSADGSNVHAVSILAVIWITGSLALLLSNIYKIIHIRHKLVGAVLVQDNIYLADHIASPFVMGLFRPKIYLPSMLHEEEQAYIIQHEQHHIRRGDHVIKILAFAALCIHWFNPLVWLAFILSCRDMEMSCDEAVLKKAGCDIRADYSTSLLNIATGRRGYSAVPLAFGEGDTKDRIKNIMNFKKPAFLVTALCFMVVAVLSITFVFNSDRMTNAKQLEQAARQSRNIGEDWEVQLSMTDDYAVMLFYSSDMSDHSYSVYRNTGLIFPDYTFIRGGSRTEIERGILTLGYGNSLILLSLNSDHVAKIVCHDAGIYDINPESPFTVIVPQGGIEIFDKEGNPVLTKMFGDE